jgi:cysteine desulfurase
MIYLDNNATRAINYEVETYLRQYNNTPMNASSIHSYGRTAKTIIEDARRKIASAIGVDDKLEEFRIIFTSSGTEANNLIMHNFRNDNIYISAIEHPSIMQAAQCYNNCKIIPVNEKGLIAEELFENMIRNTKGRKLVSIMLANNETGVIQNIINLVNIAKKHDAFFHSDAVQALGKIPFNISELGCDFMTLSSHKVAGPVGAASLIAKRGFDLESQIKGGGQERGLRSGTENVVAISGFAEAVIISVRELNLYEKKLAALRQYMETAIKSFCSTAKIYGAESPRIPNTSMIMMPNVSSETQIINFDIEGIAVSAGSACSSGKVTSSHVLEAMGIDRKEAECAIRVSLDINNTKEQLDRFLTTWKNIYKRAA